MKTLPRGTCGILDHEEDEYRSGYQDTGGNRYWSSSGLKAVLGKKLDSGGSGTKSMDLGNVIHAWLRGQLDDSRRPFLIKDSFKKEDGSAVRANSKEYAARWAEAEEKHGAGNFAVLNNSDMAQWINLQGGLMEFAQQLKNRAHDSTLHVERVFVADNQALLADDAGKPRPLGMAKGIRELKRQLMETVGRFNIKARPDVVLEHQHTLEILDWKSTAKEDPREMAEQANWLGYWLSLYFYAIALETVLKKRVDHMRLVFIPKKKESLVLVSHDPFGDEPPSWDLENVGTLGERLQNGMDFRKAWESEGIVDMRTAGRNFVYSEGHRAYR